MGYGQGNIEYGAPGFILSNAPGAPGGNNGLSISTLDPAKLVLGQDVGQAGDPAQLLSNRDIPLKGNRMRFFDITQYGYVEMPALFLTHWRGWPDGQGAMISDYGATMIANSGGYSAGYEEFAFVTANLGFFGYIGVQSWAYVIGQNGATHAKFTNGYINAFSGGQVWDGSGGAGNQHLGNLIGLFNCCNSQSGTVDNAFDVYASELNSIGSTTNPPNVTTHYGFYMEPCTAATNNYGIFINGTQQNYFGGEVRLGSNAGSAVSLLTMNSTTKGMLLARMTTVQKLAIAAVEGLLVYDLTLHQLSYFNGTVWVNL